MEILADRKSLLLHVRDVGRLTTVIPHAIVMPTHNNTFLVEVPHRVDEVKVLRNLQIAAPSPILHYYNWPGNLKPFTAQLSTAEMLTLNARAFVLNEMGTGKTMATLWALDYLMSIGAVRRALIVSPVSTLERVWADEIFWNLPHRSSITLYGTKAKRLEALAEPRDFYIINHDGVGVILDALKQASDIDAVVVDELAVYRNRRTSRWKNLQTVAIGKKYLWGLTGLPTPNAPTDAYGQIMLVNPSRFGRSFGAFRDMVMRQVSMFKWIPRDTASDVVYNLMQPSIRFRRDECLDLPPMMTETRTALLSNEQAVVYRKMVQDLKVEFSKGAIKAVNEGVKLSKLLQIALGTVYGVDGNPIRLDASPRLAVLQEILEEAPAKVIVFVPFVHVLADVVRALNAWGYSNAQVHGDVPPSVRDHIFSHFQNAIDPRVLVAHPQCMSHGLTLTQANVIVWYGPVWSNDIYEQANARIMRAGQRRNQLILHIAATPTEEQMVRRLKNKQTMQSILLDMFEKGEPI